MADASLGADSPRNKFNEQEQHPNEVHPDDCPDLYASVVRGDCLSPSGKGAAK